MSFLLQNKNRSKIQKVNLSIILFTYLIQLVYSAKDFLGKQFLKTPRILNSQENEGQHHLYPPGSSEFWYSISIQVACVLTAAFASGMTVGYTSIDKMALRVQKKKGTSDKEKIQADQILTVIEDHHLLLSTLLLTNAIAMESLPIFLHQIVPAFWAVIISTVFVVIVGEIIPQAVCTGPNQLKIAQFFVPVMKFLYCSFYPIVYPTAKLLDLILGEHGTIIYPKKDLKTLIEIHQQVDKSDEQGFNNEEYILINSLLEMTEQKVCDHMIDYNEVYKISTNEIFDREFIKKLKNNGFSEVPLYQDDDCQLILGVIRIKKILNAQNKHMNQAIGKRIPFEEPIFVAQDTSILEMLMIFQNKKQTFAFITNKNRKQNVKNLHEDLLFDINKLVVRDKEIDEGERRDFDIIGIICLKDVFEEILDFELADGDFHPLKADQFIQRQKESKLRRKKVIRRRSFNLKAEEDEEDYEIDDPNKSQDENENVNDQLQQENSKNKSNDLQKGLLANQQ